MSSNKFSEDPTVGTTQDEEPVHVSPTDTTSGKYNIVPDPRYAREYVGAGPTQSQQQRPTKSQNEPMTGSEKLGVPKDTQEK